MGPTVVCNLCGKRIAYKPSNIATLGEHLYKIHSKQNINHYCIDEHYFERKMYKTTVESWKPGVSLLTCSSCGKSGPPVIHKQQNKVANSSLGALCLLGCWPLCFLPFMLGGSNVMNLHCKHCGQYLGTFDRKTGSLQSLNKTPYNKE